MEVLGQAVFWPCFLNVFDSIPQIYLGKSTRGRIVVEGLASLLHSNGSVVLKMALSNNISLYLQTLMALFHPFTRDIFRCDQTLITLSSKTKTILLLPCFNLKTMHKNFVQHTHAVEAILKHHIFFVYFLSHSKIIVSDKCSFTTFSFFRFLISFLKATLLFSHLTSAICNIFSKYLFIFSF